MKNAILEGSNDNVTYTLLHEFEEEFHEKWQEANFAGPNIYRYIRFSSLKCQVS